MFCVSNNISLPDVICIGYRDENISIILEFQIILTPKFSYDLEFHDNLQIENQDISHLEYFMKNVMDLKPLKYQKIKIISKSFERVFTEVEKLLPSRIIDVSEIGDYYQFQYEELKEFIDPLEFINYININHCIQQ